MQD
jgi:hypothetical protein